MFWCIVMHLKGQSCNNRSIQKLLVPQDGSYMAAVCKIQTKEIIHIYCTLQTIFTFNKIVLVIK